MLSEEEKGFARQLLELIELRDLITLTDTVTNRAVTTENRKEATDAILLYSVNASQLLRRKKVKREHLYHYLAQRGQIEPVTADKSHLCRCVLKLWGSKDGKFERDDNDEDDDDEYEDNDKTNDVAQPSTSTNAQTNKQNAMTVIDGQSLAEHFVPWFYSILNSLVNGDHADWGHHHFWADAKCSIAMLSEQVIQEECQGSEAVSDKLGQVVSTEKLYLNVNVSGIKGEINNYGLVRILAGGTVHRFNSCIGVFEQTFGLIRDPHADNNWKVKFTQLRLRSQGQLQGHEKASITAPESGQLALRC